METGPERRRRKLMALRTRFSREGGLTFIAERAGLSAEALQQVIDRRPLPPKKDGTRAVKSLGDASVAKIEAGLALGVGWFDADDTGRTAPDESTPAQLVERLAQLLHQVAHEQRAELADVMAAFIRSGGAARYSLALVELLGGPMPTPSLVSLPPLPKPPPLPGPSSPDDGNPAPHSAGHAA